jgi:hypothetical protein
MLINKSIPDFNLTLVIKLSDKKGVVSRISYTQNIFVDVKNCLIDIITPTSSSLSYAYELNSGKVEF